MWNGFGLIRQALDASWLKNRAVSNNIANVNTPGYTRQTVDFEDVLRERVNKTIGNGGMYITNPRHIDTANAVSTPVITQDRSGDMRMDGNNVDIDKEMAIRTENDTQYSYLSRHISDEFKRIKMAVRDGR